MATDVASIVVTLDIGGSAAKAVAYDAASQRSLASTAAPYPAPHSTDDPAMFRPEEWWQAAVSALADLRRVLGEPSGRYLGITVSAIRIPFVLIDRAGQAVLPGLLNRDRRAAAELARIAAAIGAAEVYELTGHWLAPEFGLPKLLWTRTVHPSGWQATRFVLQLHDWFIYKLSGVVASEPSSAAMSQMLDVSHGSWANDLLDELGIPLSLMPELRPAGTMVGGLLPTVADATGFSSGTPVHLGGGDTQLSAESAGASERAAPVVVAGTTAPVQAAVNTASLPGPAARHPLLLSEHVTAGKWMVEANAGLTGGILARLEDLGDESGEGLADLLRRRGFTLSGGDPGELTILAGNPFFSPQGWARSPQPTITGLHERHRGSDVFRACLRAICYAVRSVLATLTEHSGIPPLPVVATGGMSRSAEWAQLLADVTGREVRVRPLAAIGGRAGAGLVAGEMPVMRSGGATGEPPAPAEERRFGPRAVPDHDAGFARYRQLYQAAQLELSAAGE
jgi:xylulokinase